VIVPDPREISKSQNSAATKYTAETELLAAET
jgi:hypothetical protein